MLTLLLLACQTEDPCAVNDIERCAQTEGCAVFTAVEMLPAATSGWCFASSSVYEPLCCVTKTDAEDCEAGTKYATPPDDDGEPTDTCFAYSGCDVPRDWVDCDPQPAISIGECD